MTLSYINLYRKTIPPNIIKKLNIIFSNKKSPPKQAKTLQNCNRFRTSLEEP